MFNDVDFGLHYRSEYDRTQAHAHGLGAACMWWGFPSYDGITLGDGDGDYVGVWGGAQNEIYAPDFYTDIGHAQGLVCLGNIDDGTFKRHFLLSCAEVYDATSLEMQMLTHDVDVDNASPIVSMYWRWFMCEQVRW